MVSAMTSYSSLTSRCTFVSRQHSTESDFEFPSMTKALMNSCLFIVCKSMFTIGESQRRKQQRWMETTATSSGAERTSLNEFQMLKFFKSKWKRFWIISLINIRSEHRGNKTRFARRRVCTVSS